MSAFDFQQLILVRLQFSESLLHNNSGYFYIQLCAPIL